MNAFKILSTDEVMAYVKQFLFTRTLTSVHIHHTWKPDHKSYTGKNGIALQEGMSEYHIKTRGFQAIAQHLTLLPDGQWVTGRDLNLNPASATGFNTGAFAVEMIGNFDLGHDKFGGKQSAAMFKFAAFFLEQFKLPIETIKFHREFPGAGKTCPGTGIDKAWFVGEVVKAQDTVEVAINALVKAGIITTPKYWLDSTKDGKTASGAYVGQLIMNVAKYIKEKG